MEDIVSLPLETAGPGIDSKYRLAVLSSQRALQILKHSPARVNSTYRRATTVSLQEFQAGKVPFFLDEEAVKARERDEVLCKEVLAAARHAYVDEEGNQLFPGGQDQPSTPPASA